MQAIFAFIHILLKALKTHYKALSFLSYTLASISTLKAAYAILGILTAIQCDQAYLLSKLIPICTKLIQIYTGSLKVMIIVIAQEGNE